MENKREIRQIFVERTKDLLFDKKLTLKELAKNTDLPYSSLVSWLNGTRTIQIDSLVVLAKYFGVTTDYLLGIEN